MKRPIDTASVRPYIGPVTQKTTSMEGAELTALMEQHGLLGQAGAEDLAARVGTTWRTVYRWRADEVKITRMAEKAIRQALTTTQDRSSRVRPAARKSKKTHTK